jgi:hypothetical protein
MPSPVIICDLLLEGSSDLDMLFKFGMMALLGTVAVVISALRIH